jgi:hypothetical protein
MRAQISPKRDVHGAADTTPKHQKTGSHPLLVAVVRILAQVAARDWLDQIRTEPTTPKDGEHKKGSNISPSARQDQPT